MNEKPTPRTDEQADRFPQPGQPPGVQWPELVTADFARKLERENLTFRAAQKACEDCDAPRVDRINELERELATAKEAAASEFCRLNQDVTRQSEQVEAHRRRANELEKELEQERALADRLAGTLDGLDWLAAEPPRALAAWKEARKQSTASVVQTNSAETTQDVETRR
jgi:predicted RNase H-like nuclease (RuvC/YqgF family)